MAVQTVFRRYEIKYMITLEQKEKILQAMEDYMALDRYGRTTIRNIYFDTENYRLIRRSIEKPIYKEKLRIRSYDKAMSDSVVFVELKKKYNHVVYKRRVAMPRDDAMKWMHEKKYTGEQTQISEEISCFLEYYKSLHPTVFLSYEREAYYAKDGSDFRITFDDTILCREEQLSLQEEAYGISLLPKECVLMEIKCCGGIPMWMVNVLSQEHIYKTSFSKYGVAYQTIIYPQIKEDFLHAGNIF